MSSEQEQVRQLAERIARRVAESAERTATHPSEAFGLNNELAALRQSLADLQQRLAQIESHLAPAPQPKHSAQRQPSAAIVNSTDEATAPGTHARGLSGVYVPATHPSLEKFGVEEATVSELVDFFEGAKTCELEPGGKPCDHCSMCSSRGF